MIRRIQYHGTTEDRVAGIEALGLSPLAQTATLRHRIPAIFTSDDIENAACYGDGTVVVARIASGAKYLTRTMSRSVRRGERLIDAVERWLQEAVDRGYAGVHVPDQQSGIGNMTVDENALTVVKITHAPCAVR
jgi:hypothetical protein